MEIIIAVIVSAGFWGLMYLLLRQKMIKDKELQTVIKNDKRWRWAHPNNICTIRVFLAFIACFFYIYLNWQIAGIFLFTLSAYLDGVDGRVAVSCGLITDFGKWYDPLCDKISYLLPLAYFYQKGIIISSVYWIALFLVSEICGQFFFRDLQKKWDISVEANNFGKWKTALLFVLIIYCAILNGAIKIPNFAGELFVFCTILAFLSAISKIIPKRFYASAFELKRIDRN